MATIVLTPTERLGSHGIEINRMDLVTVSLAPVLCPRRSIEICRFLSEDSLTLSLLVVVMVVAVVTVVMVGEVGGG